MPAPSLAVRPSETELLTAPALRRALIAGARRVIADRDQLNRINVFPVADGDTGNNLAQTLGSLLNGALRRRSRHVGELLQRIGNDAIDGARGNSGAILAQFFFGAAEQARGWAALDSAGLASALFGKAALAQEMAVYTVDAPVQLNGDTVDAQLLAGAERGQATHLAAGDTPVRLMVIGGDALDAPRHMWWNFVSSRKDRIVQAAADWDAQAMGQVPGEVEWIPLPERRFKA